jgi:hypothetical protein
MQNVFWILKNELRWISEIMAKNGAVALGFETEFPEADMEEGHMSFTNEEIMQCFDPVVNKIVETMNNQVDAIEAQNKKIAGTYFKFEASIEQRRTPQGKSHW